MFKVRHVEVHVGIEAGQRALVNGAFLEVKQQGYCVCTCVC